MNMKDLEEQFEEDMQRAILEGEMANCDFDSQKKYEEKLAMFYLFYKREIKKQLFEIECCMTIPDEASAKIKCEHLLKTVNALYNYLNGGQQ